MSWATQTAFKKSRRVMATWASSPYRPHRNQRDLETLRAQLFDLKQDLYDLGKAIEGKPTEHPL
jgi:hypothetical protein